MTYMQIEMLSWGYLLQRGTVLGIHVQNQLSRIPGGFPDRHGGIPEDIIEGGYMVEKNSDITIGGRIVLNLWRILRVEVDFYFLRLTNQFLPFSKHIFFRLHFKVIHLKIWFFIFFIVECPLFHLKN